MADVCSTGTVEDFKLAAQEVPPSIPSGKSDARLGTTARTLLTIRDMLDKHHLMGIEFSQKEISAFANAALGLKVPDDVYKKYIRPFQKAHTNYLGTTAAARTKVGRIALSILRAQYEMRPQKTEAGLTEFVEQFVEPITYKILHTNDKDTDEKIRSFLAILGTPLDALLEVKKSTLSPADKEIITAYTGVGRMGNMLEDILDEYEGLIPEGAKRSGRKTDVDHILSLKHKDYPLGKKQQKRELENNARFLLARAIKHDLNGFENLLPLLRHYNIIKSSKVADPSQVKEFARRCGGKQCFAMSRYVFGEIANRPSEEVEPLHQRLMTDLYLLKKADLLDTIYNHYSIPNKLRKILNKELSDWIRMEKENPQIRLLGVRNG